MSATDQIRALLDEYMGTTRNGQEPRIEFDNPRVCKSYLLDCCPNEILSGTRMDLGNCLFIHDPAHKADYRKEPDTKKFQYELDALEHLEAFIRDCDQRTDVAKAKLRETQEELTDEASQKAEHINQLSEQIGTKLAKAEQLGADGHVEESLRLMKEVEELNLEKAKSEADLRTAIPTSTYQQQKLRVCEVCSAYLGVHDNDRRLADHFGGKLHLGFIEIRQKLAELRQYVNENHIVRRRRFEGYNRSIFITVEERREKERIRERERELEKSERRQKSRSRSRSRSHSHSRRHSRHRNGKHSHRSRKRHHRSSNRKSEDRH
ncbi:unnamed protein product [Schistosoma margrebowiei]|uniref:RNA-binding protein Luc7-like 2 n=2 Tax=Schistosoma margrebowiei TaxID=48269 RepID=A0AA85AR31_9TREM|nr:unnamed protein product [Schistosoma margrebowiei]